MNDRILWGQIVAVAAIVVLAIWSATQWTAGALAYQPELGRPWFVLWSYPVYLPPAFFWWWFSFDAYAPDIFLTGAAIAASGGLLSILVAIAMSVWRARERQRAQTYGSAHWAAEADVRRAGLLGEDGVVLGRLGETYLRHDGPEHVLCFAPTRSGKGVGLVVPTLLTWPGSCIVHDIKGENWQLTSGFRGRHGRVLLFDPTNPASSSYNPLLEVRKGAWEVRDVQNIADVLVDPEGSLEKRNHWEKTSHALLVGTILHVLYAEADKTLAGVASFLANPKRRIETTLAAMKTTPHLGKGQVHPVVAAAAQELLNKSENERSGVLSTAMSFLGLYRDPVVARVTGTSQWRIADLVSGPAPVSLYLVVPPGDISRTKPLIRLILNQIGRRLTENLNSGCERQRLLVLLDEFPALGRLDFFESTLAFMAGYGIKAFLIAQSLNQIEKAYGPNNAILDNCHVRVSFATNDERTARRISDALGTATEMRAMKNYAGHRLSPWLGHLMVSRTETSRQLLTPGEIMQLPAEEEIVMAAGLAPVRARKARYFVDPRFMERIMAPAKIGEGPAHVLAGDDWSDMSSEEPSSAPQQQSQPELPRQTAPDDAPSTPVTKPEPETPQETGEALAEAPASDLANGGIRREPGLGQQEDIVPEPVPAQSEFEFTDYAAQDNQPASRHVLNRAMAANARRASLDPGDGIAL